MQMIQAGCVTGVVDVINRAFVKAGAEAPAPAKKIAA
jgi:hypothetical protein